MSSNLIVSLLNKCFVCLIAHPAFARVSFFLDVLRKGDRVVESGETIAKISPSDSTLIIKAAVPAKDISKISVCETPNISKCDRGKVKLRVTAYLHPDYGVLNE